MSSQSARQLLINWANEQQHWVRAIARDVLATRQLLSEESIEEIYEQCLVERDLRQGEITVVPKLTLDKTGEVIVLPISVLVRSGY